MMSKATTMRSVNKLRITVTKLSTHCGGNVALSIFLIIVQTNLLASIVIENAISTGSIR